MLLRIKCNELLLRVFNLTRPTFFIAKVKLNGSAKDAIYFQSFHKTILMNFMLSF